MGQNNKSDFLGKSRGRPDVCLQFPAVATTGPDDRAKTILYQVGRLGFTGFILQGVYWIMRGLLAQV